MTVAPLSQYLEPCSRNLFFARFGQIRRDGKRAWSRSGFSLAETVIGLGILSLILVSLLVGFVAYQRSAKALQVREEALGKLSDRMEIFMAMTWKEPQKPGTFTEAKAPGWAREIVNGEGPYRFEIVLTEMPQAYATEFWESGHRRRYTDLYRCEIIVRWGVSAMSLITVKGGRS